MKLRMNYRASALPGDVGAFTLIELLVVVAIMGLLLALVAPAVVPMMQSSNMNKAAEMISDELNFARQTALTQNRDVEVRFYKLPSPSNAGDLQFRAFRSFAAIGNANKLALGNVKSLPVPIIIAQGADLNGSLFSTLLDAPNSSRPGLMTGFENLPQATATPYISFLFRATEGTNLIPNTGNWYLTLFSENAPKLASTGFPANYFTVQIDPVTGRVLTYRP